MTTELEQALREGMERFTHGMRVPEGLARKADRHRQRRRRTARVLAAAGTAAIVTAAGAVLAGVTGASGQGAPPRIQTAAYVVSRVEHALAASARDCRYVMFSRTSYAQAPYYTRPIPGGWDWSLAPARSLTRAAAITEWKSCHSYVRTAWSATGQPIFTEQVTKTAILDNAHYQVPAGATVAVIYGPRAWWRTGLTVAKAFVPMGSRVAHSQWGHILPLMPGDLVGGIRDQITHHYLRIAGRQRIDGVETVKLVSADSHSTGGALWVNASTYLPVRSQSPVKAPTSNMARYAAEPTLGLATTDFRLLPATPANRARLHVTVPAGFRQVRPPWNRPWR
jgi:hypothetical protein